MRKLMLVALATVALAGCAEDSSPPQIETDAQAIQYWLDLARTEVPGASDHQIDVLERALERGTVLRADLSEMLPEYYDCLDAAGLTYYVDEIEPVPGSGIYLPNVSVVADGDVDEQDAVADLSFACAAQNEMYIASAYSNQPSSVEAQDRVWVGETMCNCLTERGYVIDDEASAAEVRAVYDADVMEHGQNADYRPC